MRRLAFALVLAACATAHSAAHMDPSLWFQGSVEQAFAAAKAQNKPIFLYWGAVWCPPCNQIKSLVFTTPRFAELIKSVVPVYLDGDTAGAQEWADKLHVSGYPTMLVLDPGGREVMRIAEFVDLDGFTAAFTGALTATRPLQETIDRALSGHATEQDWNILRYDSYEEWLGGPDAACATLLKLFRAVPEHDVALRATLAARFWEHSIGLPDPRVAEEARKLLDVVFANDDAVFAARSTLETMSAEFVKWHFSEASPARTAVIDRWTKAARSLAVNPKGSVSDRLLAWVPIVELWQLDHAGQPLPADLLTGVQRAVAQADHDATSVYTRHAVISDAGQLLEEAGDLAGARALMTKELQTTDTPWYYESVLAELEMKAGNEGAGLDWAAKAHQSAKGNATRVQWIALDLRLNAQSKRVDRAKILALWRELLDAAVALPDGVSGRNLSRMSAVKAAMNRNPGPMDEQKKLLEVTQDFLKRCVEHHPQKNCAAFIFADHD